VKKGAAMVAAIAWVKIQDGRWLHTLRSAFAAQFHVPLKYAIAGGHFFWRACSYMASADASGPFQ
jgi:hypothetical protein